MKYLCSSMHFFPENPSGSSRVAWDIAQLMRDRGHEVSLAYLYQGEPGTFEHEGVHVLRISANHTGGALLRPQSYLRAVSEQLGQYEPVGGWDVVHGHLAYLQLGSRRALGSGPKYVYTFHSPIVDEQHVRWAHEGWKGQLKRVFGSPYLWWMEHEALRTATGIHALSAFSRAEIERHHGLGKGVDVIPHWRRPGLRRRLTREEARDRLGWPQDRPALFTLRRHAHRMGIDVAIDALAPLTRAQRCYFAIGGDGPLRPELEAQARLLGALVPGEMEFLGRIDDEVLALAYQAADLFVLPTRALECFGLITLEAMAFGCPVLGTDAGATPELIEPVSPSLIVPAGDVAALRSRVEAWLAGEIRAPAPATIEGYIRDQYGLEHIGPRLEDWLLRGTRGVSGR